MAVVIFDLPAGEGFFCGRKIKMYVKEEKKRNKHSRKSSGQFSKTETRGK